MLFSMLATCVLLAVQPISPIHSASIEISPEVSLFDQDTTVVVNNLDPDEIVSIQAEAVDDQQIHWGSRASFQSDKNGIINLSVQSPLEGTYFGIDPMGLLWSMQSESNPTASFCKAPTAPERPSLDTWQCSRSSLSGTSLEPSSEHRR